MHTAIIISMERMTHMRMLYLFCFLACLTTLNYILIFRRGYWKKQLVEKPDFFPIFNISVRFLRTPANFCTTETVDRVVIIMSRPESIARREVIRQTWAYHLKKTLNFSPVFMLGQTFSSMRHPLAQSIADESQISQDLIIANFVDTYKNLSLKTATALVWIKYYCEWARIILKADEDAIVFSDGLQDLLKKRNGSTDLIIGQGGHRNVIRRKSSKWYMDPKTYSNSKYPKYILGGCYILYGNAAKRLADAVLDYQGGYFYLEDVFFNGILADQLGIERDNKSGYKFAASKHTSATKVCQKNMVAGHYMKKADFIRRYFNDYLKCRQAKNQKRITRPKKV